MLRIASSTAHASPADALRLSASSETLALGRIAHEVGDAEILAGLSPDRPTTVRLGAIRLAPFMLATEDALPPLASLARGGDPWLSVEAVWSAERIIRALNRAGLDRREASDEDLKRARRDFEDLSKDSSARPDLRYGAGFVAAAVGAYLNP